jgi:CTP synthase
MKYIFVAGGVMSGIGKGIATASIGRILKSKGFKVTAIKIDPYINVDAGTMNPVEHGEVFVTEDGVECDQDVGNYERFLDENIYTDNYMTTGRVYLSVITKERNLEYGGECISVVPGIPNEVISIIKRAGKKVKADFTLIEIGGTVGEYQNLLFLEAARIMKFAHPKDVLFILVSYLPIPSMVGEMKTKPTQQAVRNLNEAGLQADIILARAETVLDEPRKKKLAVYCNIHPDDVISAPDVTSIYQVPVNFEKENLGNRIVKKVGLKPRKSDLKEWKGLVDIINNSPEPVNIGIVGKYFESGKFTLTDSYISVIEAVKHAAFSQHRKPNITWISAEEFEGNPKLLANLKNFDGIIVPGGFGNRGIEGKIKAIEYCRTHAIPFFGLCLGMQLATIEFARHVCGLTDATSAEFKQPSKNIVIDVMEEQKVLLKEKRYGGTMRLGSYDCALQEKTISKKAYGQANITERHRHRYELNNAYRQTLEKNGMVMAGVNPEKNLVEIIEIPSHPFFVATQFHPEFKSRPLKPHPLFRAFVQAAIKK